MTVSAEKKAELERKAVAEKRAEKTQRLFLKVPRFVWREAREELGISKTEADDDDLMIVLAKSVDKKVTWQELDQMEPLEVSKIVLGDLAPTEDELMDAVAQAVKEASK